MKKLVIALSIVCAGALAFADDAQWQSPWFTGIGTDATALDALNASNGSWTIPTDAAKFDANTKTISFELGDNEEGTFTVTDAATEKTAQKITVSGVFTPCSASDLMTGAKMNEANAQIGFAVVSTGDTTTPYKYYAWVGKTDGATAEGGTALSDWVAVGTCASATATTELTITFAYWGGNPKVSFSAKNGTSEAVTMAETELKSTAATKAYKVSSIACSGSGSISALSGDTGLAVATVDGTPYATVDAAIAAATNGQAVEVVETPKGDVDSGKVTVDATKECVVTKTDAGTTVAVQPKTSILEAITINGVALTKDVAKLRTFLNTNCNDVYAAAESTTEKLKAALEATPTDKNGLALWQDYALGIDPATKLAMDYATDTATDGVTVKLATEVVPSGDYTITYKCAQVGGTASAESTDASAIKLPLETGRYKVSVVFSAPAKTSGGDAEPTQN